MSLNARTASKLFNSGKLSALADGDLSFVRKVAKDYLGVSSGSLNVSEVYESAYKQLSKDYRAEYYFKNTIANKVLLGRHSLNTAVMLSEFRVGKSKADCVVINGKSTCYEIKSDYDNLSRLEEQLNDYLGLFDEVYVVCSQKHLHTVLDATDPSVGVIELTQRNNLSVKRKASHRVKPIDVDLMIKSLRKDEYTLLVERATGQIPSVPNSRLMTSCRQVLRDLEPSIIANCFIDVLKEKRFNDSSLINALPKILVNAAISYQFSRSQADSLKRIFCTSEESRCTYPTLEESNLSC
ncbi:sce7726 family protein [Aliagarivorans marinus]|uniref:sce7726 family protein n=1 Tax=Aliagarivorans marinus TaxID=561965 RepID=UPI00040ED1EE|nr:sce7726 family protein [Aliagarivorans marinus]